MGGARRFPICIAFSIVVLATSCATPVPPPTTKPENPVADAVFGLCLDSAGRIYVNETRIVRLDDISGAGMTVYSSLGLKLMFGIAADADARIYVTDSSNQRIVRMDDMGGSN